MADTTEVSGVYFAALWVCRKRKQTRRVGARDNCTVVFSHPAFAGHTCRFLPVHTADTTSNADDVSDPLLASLLDLDLTSS